MACHHEAQLIKDFKPKRLRLYSVQCSLCGKSTPWVTSEEKAHDAWKVLLTNEYLRSTY